MEGESVSNNEVSWIKVHKKETQNSNLTVGDSDCQYMHSEEQLYSAIEIIEQDSS